VPSGWAIQSIRASPSTEIARVIACEVGAEGNAGQLNRESK
jgi:hypothetical protein